ncbi:uncharacterized protein LOC131017790 [Salvia miltiorrhiza]|uniref:uncharacterized protein LOC131017790 n=1 Tax=Salvia miltiorrhiza TaxID=226208 RepID=UPI0025AD37E6|nr:uncharacterized protein LOC131017790 [Salvia miltiorrhiza]
MIANLLSLSLQLFYHCFRDTEREIMEGPSWSGHFPAAARYQRCFICPTCNARSCRRLQSHTLKNPGRFFFSCPDDNFFKWEDEVRPHEWIEVPNCGGCGAGVCRVRKETAGPNAGRIMFMCRVKEGEGSCGYRVWQDELEMIEACQAEERALSRSGIVNCNGEVTDAVEVSKQRDEGTDHVSPSVETCDDLMCREVTSSRRMDREVVSGKMDRLKYPEEKSNLTSRRPHKRSRYGDIIASGFPISASFSTVRVALNSTSTRHCWMVDALRENLSTELNGWWGRLVFRPKRCLMTYALKPSISCVSNPLESTFVVEDILVNLSGSITPQRNSKGVESNRKLSLNLEQHHSPIDSTYVVQEKILVNYSDATTSTRSLLGARNHSEPLVTQAKRNSAAITLSPVFLKEPSCKPTTRGGMSNSISNVFHQAAERLQDELLDRLETMAVKDHAAMSREAEATFAALDCLLLDYQDFKWRVEELIRCASQLVEIDRAMPTSDSFQKLVEICSRERGRLDEINHKHAEAVEALINSKKHVKVLQEEISSTLDWLFQIESDVSCCEVEMRCLELQLEETSKNKEVLEGKYLIASKELEESQKLLLEQREVERNAAKAAFDRARALLRG